MCIRDRGTSPLISGNYAGYSGYYNFFNAVSYTHLVGVRDIALNRPLLQIIAVNIDVYKRQEPMSVRETPWYNTATTAAVTAPLSRDTMVDLRMMIITMTTIRGMTATKSILNNP